MFDHHNDHSALSVERASPQYLRDIRVLLARLLTDHKIPLSSFVHPIHPKAVRIRLLHVIIRNMTDFYLLKPQEGHWEQTIKKSDFLIYLARVNSEEEAKEKIEQVNKEHYKA
nr:hypothetical protein [Serratia marcescens]